MESSKPERIPNSWHYWENLEEEKYYAGVSELVRALRNFGSKPDFLIDGVDFTIKCPERPTSYKDNQHGSGKSLELVAKYISLSFSESDSRFRKAQIKHEIYDCPYTGTPEKSHLFKISDGNGERARLSFIYGPSSKSERKLFWDPPKKSYQESNSDKN
ncbi:MAG: hypothetical protein ABEI74_03315 [Candidatus Pacearchaeota archaeon]